MDETAFTKKGNFMKRYLGIVAGVAMAMSVQAADTNRTFADIYTDCGLGAMIAPKNDAVAAVTNVTFDLGTTAISSNATSPETCQGGQASAAAFIFEAYPSIEQDLARGEGEHLNALLKIAGCETGADADVAASLRRDLADIADSEGYSDRSTFERAEDLFEALDTRATAAACSMT